MKKFFVALLALALIAGNAFAEVTVGGSLIGAWGILSGTTAKDAKRSGQNEAQDQPWVWEGPAGAGAMHTIRGRLQINTSSEDGKLGGWLQVRPGNDKGALASVWWKPISQVNFTLGNIWGGGVYTAGVASADDTILNGDIGIINFWGRGHGWSGNRGIEPYGMDIDYGAAVDLYPVDNLHIIVAVPFSHANVDGGWNITSLTAGQVYANTVAKIDFTVPDLLQIVAYYDGGTSLVHKRKDDG
jgi:hypothetical protein